MKLLAFFAVVFLFVGLSQQIPKLVNCPPDFELSAGMRNGCGVVTCEGPGQVSGVGCGTYQCAAGTQIGYKESDGSQPYPECCGGPICAESA